jgi:hypothetical protein
MKLMGICMVLTVAVVIIGGALMGSFIRMARSNQEGIVEALSEAVGLITDQARPATNEASLFMFAPAFAVTAETPTTGPTHFECIECGKWDYVKNLTLHDARIYFRAKANKGGRFDKDFACPIRVHAECSQVERCGCANGWRAKQRKGGDS